MDELGVKLTGPVSLWNLDSGKSNFPGYTTETHGPLPAGTASSKLIFSSRSVVVRIRFCGVGHLELVRWIMTSYFTMRSFKFRYHEFQIKFCYISIEIYIYCVNRKLCFCIYNSFIKVCQKRQKCRLGVLTVNDKNIASQWRWKG